MLIAPGLLLRRGFSWDQGCTRAPTKTHRIQETEGVVAVATQIRGTVFFSLKKEKKL